MAKIKTLDDCASGRDYVEYAQAHDLPMRKNGSYIEIEQNGVTVRFPDCDKAMKKEDRSLINWAFIAAGLAAILAAVAWVVM